MEVINLALAKVKRGYRLNAFERGHLQAWLIQKELKKPEVRQKVAERIYNILKKKP